MKRLSQLLLLLPFLWAIGCQKDVSNLGSETTGMDEVEVPLNVHVSLDAPDGRTKAIISGKYEGDNMPDGFDYGFFVCESESTKKPHKKNSWNGRAFYTANQEEGASGSWSYQYVNNFETGELSSNQYPNITITAKENEDKTGDIYADIYAYAPYIQEAYKNGPTAIPISIAKDILEQVDLMYAVENKDKNHFNKGLNPKREGDDPLEAEFHFKHALALLVFEFKILNAPQSYQFQNICIQKTNAEQTTTAKLCDQATFNIVEGVFSNYHETNSIKMSLSDMNIIAHGNDEPDLTLQMAMIPTPIEDDELQFIVTFNNRTVRPFVLKKEYLTHEDGETVGFEGGYKYTFRFTLDNYLTLTDFTRSDWKEETLKDAEI